MKNHTSPFAVMAPEWLPRLLRDQHSSINVLFFRWFHEAPSLDLLHCLSSHLGSVQPAPGFSQRIVCPISSDIAILMLAHRFALPASTSIQDLLSDVLYRFNTTKNPLIVDTLVSGLSLVVEWGSMPVDMKNDDIKKIAFAMLDDGYNSIQSSTSAEAAVFVDTTDLCQSDDKASATTTTTMILSQHHQQQQQQRLVMLSSALRPRKFVPLLIKQAVDFLASHITSRIDHHITFHKDTDTNTYGSSHNTIPTALLAQILCKMALRGPIATHIIQSMIQIVIDESLSAIGSTFSTNGGDSGNSGGNTTSIGNIKSTANNGSTTLKHAPRTLAVSALYQHLITPSSSVSSQPSSQRAIDILVEKVFYSLSMDSCHKDRDTCSTSNIPASVLQSIFLPQSLLSSSNHIHLLIVDTFLIQKLLPPPTQSLVLDYLKKNQQSVDALGEAARRISSLWSDKKSIQRLSPAHQAYITSSLVGCMQRMGRDGFQREQDVMPRVLHGITVRLESPFAWIRRQGMRAGHAMSSVLALSSATGGLLFDDEDLSLVQQEIWWDDTGLDIDAPVAPHTHDDELDGDDDDDGMRCFQPSSMNTLNHAAATTTAVLSAPADNDVICSEDSNEEALTETDSDDEFEQYNISDTSDTDDHQLCGTAPLSRNNNNAATGATASSPLQLRDIVSMLQNADTDWQGQFKAIQRAEELICASPDELPQYSVSLTRALLYSKIPGWADEEIQSTTTATAPSTTTLTTTKIAAPTLEERRFSSLVALACHAPMNAGIALANEIYSPSADIQQRARALSVLSIASKELSSSLDESRKSGQHGTSSSSLSLSMMTTSASTGHGNRFLPIAAAWTTALLKECDAVRHGVDLFGRDYYLLGRLLCTLGSFLEACQGSADAVPIAATVLELVKGSKVHNNNEPFVRRAALMAVAHALMAVPPASLTTALFIRHLDAVHQSGASNNRSAMAVLQNALADRVEWASGWIGEVSDEDHDAGCRALAGACKDLHRALMSRSLAMVVDERDGLAHGGGIGRGKFMLPGRGLDHIDNGTGMRIGEIVLPRLGGDEMMKISMKREKL